MPHPDRETGKILTAIFFFLHLGINPNPKLTPMLRSLIILTLFFFIASIQAQDRGTVDVISLSGRYALPRDYKETYEGQAAETGMLNSLTAAFFWVPGPGLSST